MDLGTTTQFELPAGLKLFHILLKERDAKKAREHEQIESKDATAVIRIGLALGLRSDNKDTIWEIDLTRKVHKGSR